MAIIIFGALYWVLRNIFINPDYGRIRQKKRNACWFQRVYCVLYIVQVHICVHNASLPENNLCNRKKKKWESPCVCVYLCVWRLACVFNSQILFTSTLSRTPLYWYRIFLRQNVYYYYLSIEHMKISILNILQWDNFFSFLPIK